MKYKVDGWNNFCRVFRLPNSYPSEFCFGGGISVNIRMVDWFNPVPQLSIPVISKEAWLEKYGKFESVEIDMEELEKELIPWLKQKMYIEQGIKYLVIYEFGGSTVLEG
jgi:hypothetical protein